MTDTQSDLPLQARLAAVEGLLIRYFDDEAVVFDPLSWDAHLLNPAAIAVVELLLESHRSEAEIAAFLANALEADEQPQAAVHTARLIRDLQSLGLVHLAE